MGKMIDNFRAWWNDMGDRFSNPGQLAQLSVADLEKAVSKAKDAAAITIGRPIQIQNEITALEKTDAELTTKIQALMRAQQEDSARRYAERQVDVRKQLASKRVDYQDAKEASDSWLAKIRSLENELAARRNKANDLQAKYETAKAEQKLGKTMKNLDSLTGSDDFSRLEARVGKEQAKAAGYSALSGLNERVSDEQIIRNAEVDDILAQYRNQG